jgi:hypothetical protein
MIKFAAALAAAGLAATVAASAQAHAKLVSSDPAEGAAVAAPPQIVLKFSEKLQAPFSSATLTMPAMNNMAVPAKAAVAKDGQTLVVTPAKPLAAGAYAVNWRVVSADTHKMQGAVNFTVR